MDAKPKAGQLVKAISLWEPWASLMRTGAKRIETRSFLTHYRGPFLICASARRNLGELIHLLSLWHFQGGLAPLVGKPLDLTGKSWPGVELEDLCFGKAVALVDLLACKRTGDLTLAEIQTDEPFGDFSVGRYGWITGNLRTFEPFPVKGHQGVFDVRLPTTLQLTAPGPLRAGAL